MHPASESSSRRLLHPIGWERLRFAQHQHTLLVRDVPPHVTSVYHCRRHRTTERELSAARTAQQAGVPGVQKNSGTVVCLDGVRQEGEQHMSSDGSGGEVTVRDAAFEIVDLNFLASRSKQHLGDLLQLKLVLWQPTRMVKTGPPLSCCLDSLRRLLVT